jgi:hypothetical protein
MAGQPIWARFRKYRPMRRYLSPIRSLIGEPELNLRCSDEKAKSIVGRIDTTCHLSRGKRVSIGWLGFARI